MIRIVPGKTILSIKLRTKTKMSLTMKTTDKIKNFAVYIAGNGKKYKKVADVSGRQACNINIKKYGKNAKIKVRAYVKNNGKKYYGKYSKVKRVRK